jgi:hypothetical protein
VTTVPTGAGDGVDGTRETDIAEAKQGSAAAMNGVNQSRRLRLRIVATNIRLTSDTY